MLLKLCMSEMDQNFGHEDSGPAWALAKTSSPYPASPRDKLPMEGNPEKFARNYPFSLHAVVCCGRRGIPIWTLRWS